MSSSGSWQKFFWLPQATLQTLDQDENQPNKESLFQLVGLGVLRWFFHRLLWVLGLHSGPSILGRVENKPLIQKVSKIGQNQVLTKNLFPKVIVLGTNAIRDITNTIKNHGT